MCAFVNNINNTPKNKGNLKGHPGLRSYLKSVSDLKVRTLTLPRYKKAPARIDSKSQPDHFETPCDYHRSLYYEACDLLLEELEGRFQQKDLLRFALS